MFYVKQENKEFITENTTYIQDMNIFIKANIWIVSSSIEPVYYIVFVQRLQNLLLERLYYVQSLYFARNILWLQKLCI